MTILTINVGSSSARITLYGLDQQIPITSHHFTSHAAASDITACLRELVGEHSVDAVCHRIVHAGPDCTATAFIDETVERHITENEPLAPLHNPVALRWLKASRSQFPGAQQIAVFDTDLYATLPAVAARYGLPEELAVRRMGFHGLAHRSMLNAIKAQTSKPFSDQKIITLQLGSGCSATASIGGQAIDTSMGFTPMEGLMMGTRSGDLDPGLVLHLLSQKGRTVDALDVLLTKQSGLLGVSGISGDVRELLASDDDRAALAIDMFCYRARKYIGAFAAAMGGLDCLAFGGGIGENQPQIRSRILQRLEFLGLQLDSSANANTTGTTAIISTAVSSVTTLVVEVDENNLMASDVRSFLRAQKTP